MKLKKKGISPVVATVLIVLLTVTAVVFISGAIGPLIRGNLDKTQCIDYEQANTYFTFEEQFDVFNCFNATENYYQLSIRARNADNPTEKSVIGFQLIFIDKDQGSSQNVEAKLGEILPAGFVMNQDPSATELGIPRSGEARAYRYTPPGGVGNIYEELEIAPILENRRCKTNDKIRISDIC